jgi:DNA-binding XRE family transcriptional regulator
MDAVILKKDLTKNAASQYCNYHNVVVYEEFGMTSKEFKKFRAKLGKTQRQMAQLLGVSIKAVHSYEQGWRSVPAHVERQIFFLVSRLKKNNPDMGPCWYRKACPPEKKKKCPAWEFRAGDLCWFISGTICDGHVYKSWKEKMNLCRTCEVFKSLF